MATQRYFFDEGNLIGDINGTDVTLAEVRSISVTPAAEHAEFDGPDSIKRQDVKRHQFRVNVDLTLGSWDEDLGQYWLQGGGTEGDTKSTTINDQNDVALFNLTATQPMTDGVDQLKAVVNETDFPEMPVIDGSEGEYMSVDLSGTGTEITFTNETVA